MPTSNLTDDKGYLSPWGQGQMDGLASDAGWVSFPGELKFHEDGDLSQPAFLWLAQVSQRGNLPLPVSAPESAFALFGQYGVAT